MQTISRQPAQKIGGILEGGTAMNLMKLIRERLFSLVKTRNDSRLDKFDQNMRDKAEKEWTNWDDSEWHDSSYER